MNAARYLEYAAIPNITAPYWHHGAHGCTRGVPLASRQSTPHDHPLPNTGQRGVPTRYPPRSWFLLGDLGRVGSAGTVALLRTVCFACPTFAT